MDSSVRFLRRLASVTTLHLAVLVFAVATLGACGDDVSARVMCSSADDCGRPLDMTTPICCGGYCMATSAGCESSYRYLTSAPQFGDCVDVSVCTPPDMTVTIDFSKPNADAGN